MVQPQRQVLGFLFDPLGLHVALIRKDHPEWQAGLLNGLGGHVKEGESIVEAMAREFKEESRVDIPCDNWIHFALLNGHLPGRHPHSVWCFKARSSRIHDVQSTGSELVGVFLIAGLGEQYGVVWNMRYLIPLALDPDPPHPPIFSWERPTPTGRHVGVVAVMDDRTCDQCRELHGSILPAEDAEHLLPVHQGDNERGDCRCRLVNLIGPDYELPPYK